MQKVKNEIKRAASKMQGAIENQKNAIEGAKYEGRNERWTKDQTLKATQKAREAAMQAYIDAQKALLIGRAEVRHRLKSDKPYDARQYHSTKMSALSQGLSDEQLIQVYQNVLNDPEAFEYKKEYEEILSLKIKDEGKQLEFEELRRNNMSQDERDQERDLRFIDTMEKHAEMIKGLAASNIGDVLNGNGPGTDLLETVDLAIENAEQNSKVQKTQKEMEAYRNQRVSEYEKEMGVKVDRPNMEE